MGFSSPQGLSTTFHAIFLLVIKDLIAVRRLRKRKAVSNDVIKSYAILLELGDQLVDIALNQRLPGMNCQCFVKNLANGKVIVRHRIDAQYRH